MQIARLETPEGQKHQMKETYDTFLKKDAGRPLNIDQQALDRAAIMFKDNSFNISFFTELQKQVCLYSKCSCYSFWTTSGWRCRIVVMTCVKISHCLTGIFTDDTGYGVSFFAITDLHKLEKKDGKLNFHRIFCCYCLDFSIISY